MANPPAQRFRNASRLRLSRSPAGCATLRSTHFSKWTRCSKSRIRSKIRILNLIREFYLHFRTYSKGMITECWKIICDTWHTDRAESHSNIDPCVLKLMRLKLPVAPGLSLNKAERTCHRLSLERSACALRYRCCSIPTTRSTCNIIFAKDRTALAVGTRLRSKCFAISTTQTLRHIARRAAFIKSNMRWKR